MVQIKFIVLGANSAVGGFAPGDTARVSEEMARHLVEEAGVAQYVRPVPAEAAAEGAPAAVPETARRAPAKRKPRVSEADASAGVAAGGLSDASAESKPEPGLADSQSFAVAEQPDAVAGDQPPAVASSPAA